ncbi:hypothetical protein MMC16_003169 [Acarospora aff. strigata]|nr:hypothetical protein [Acarospora aff. strigata]
MHPLTSFSKSSGPSAHLSQLEHSSPPTKPPNPSSPALNPTHPSNGTPYIPLPLLHSAASSTAELVSRFILTPADVLKQNAQMVRRSPSYKTKAFDTSTTITALRNSKPRGQLWTGYAALAARNLPLTAMQFSPFEHLKKRRKGYHERQGGPGERYWGMGL